MFKAVQMINEINAELGSEYESNACKWADENHDEAWSKAINRFDRTLVEAIEMFQKNGGVCLEAERMVEKEGEIYKRTILDLIKKFKSSKGVDEEENFLRSLEEGA